LLRRYLIAGLLIWLPLGVTLLVFKLLVGLVEQLIEVVPAQYHPEALLGVEIPYFDVLLTLIAMFVIMLLTGLVVTNLFGRKLVKLWEALLGRIPVVRSIYQSAKQVVETVFSSTGKSFRKVLLIEYPRKGLYTLAFQTGNSAGEVQAKTGEDVTTVFIPTTPNPTSGFIILVPTKDVIELDMNVDEALKMVISLGMVEPQWPQQAKSLDQAPESKPDVA